MAEYYFASKHIQYLYNILMSRYIEAYALFLILVAALVYSGLGALTKQILNEFDLPPMEIAWIRCVFTLIGPMAYLFYKRKPIFGPPELRTWIFVRGLIGAGIQICYFFAIKFLHLGDAIVLNSLNAPLAAVLAWFYLGENVNFFLQAAILFSVLGTVFIYQPDFMGSEKNISVMGFALGLTLSLISAIGYVVVRYLKEAHTCQLIVCWTLLGTISFPVVGYFMNDWFLPPQESIPWFVGMILAGILGQVLVNYACRLAPAGSAAVVRTSDILWAYLFGLFFGEVPNTLTIIGAVLVSLSILGIAANQIIKLRKKQDSKVTIIFVARTHPVLCGAAKEIDMFIQEAKAADINTHIVTYPWNRLKQSNLSLSLTPRGSYGFNFTPDPVTHRPNPITYDTVLDANHYLPMAGELLDIILRGDPDERFVVCSYYIVPHASLVTSAVNTLPPHIRERVTTVSRAVGTDITRILQENLDESKFGTCWQILSDFYQHDQVSVVSRTLLQQVEQISGTVKSELGLSKIRGEKPINILYPPIASSTTEGPKQFSKPFIFTHSRLVRSKGILELVEAFLQSKFHGEYILAIAGEGPLREECEERSRQHDDICFLGETAHERCMELLKQCAIFVSPTYAETFGMSVAEAGSYCKGPLVVSNIPSLQETTGGHAVFVEPQNVDSLKQGLDRVYLMPDKERKEIHSRLVEHCSRFSIKKVFEEFSSQLGISIKEKRLKHPMSKVSLRVSGMSGVISPCSATDCYSPLSDIILEKLSETSEADVHFTFHSNV